MSVESIDDYKVENSVKKKGRTFREFLVKWVGYGEEHNSWEPETNLTSARDTVKAYMATEPVALREPA